MKTVYLKNASLIGRDAKVISGQDLFVREGRIDAILPAGSKASDQKREEISPEEIIDCSRYYVTPGLANLHVHTAMNIFKGIAEDVTPDAWFNERIWPYESQMTDEDVYVGTLLGIAEMIDNGVTAFADHYFGEEQVLKAVKETGIRCSLAPTVFGTAPDFAERLSQVSSFIEAHRKDSGRISFHMGAHSDYTCPAPTLGKIIDEAKRIGVPVHLHLSEEEPQVIRSREKTGKTPFAVMKEAGGFDLPVLIAHGLWIEEEDLPYLREDTWFASCPKTYMKLAMGKGGFYRFCDVLNYGFGTDGAASSNTLNPAEQARMFGLLEKYQQKDSTLHPAAEIWRHLIGGQDALPFGAGLLTEGAPADLVIWDLFSTDTFPFYDPVTAILYSSNRSNVRYTMVEGDFLKYDGKLTMNTEELFADAIRLQKELLKRGKGKANVLY